MVEKSDEEVSQNDMCKVVDLRTPTARYLESRIAIANDLAFVLASCSMLIENLQSEGQKTEGERTASPLIEALWTSILIVYERCFSSGKRVSLQHEDLNRIDPSGGTLALHKHYESMRDKHLAHSINPFAMTKIGAILSSESSRTRQVEGISILSVRHVAATVEEASQLGNLVNKLRIRVVEECDRLLDEDVLQEARELDIDALYAQEEMFYQVPGPESAGTPRA